MLTKEQAAAMKEQAKKEDKQLYKVMCWLEQLSKDQLQEVINVIETQKKKGATI